MIKLDKTTAIPFNESFLIPIKADIEKLFGSDKVEFQITISENKIIIESPEILEDLDFQDKPRVKEAINVS